jgi:hypothetical protein
MKPLRWKTLCGFLLATVLTAPAWGADTALPGTLNYVEGQANIGDQTLNAKSVGSIELQTGQSLQTENGKAEILLTPGVFLRVGENSTVKMVSSNLTNTEADLVKGQATVEVAEIHQYNDLRIGEDGAITHMVKDGLYAFDADHAQVRVLKGEALVQDNDQNVKVKGGHELDLSQSGRLKPTKFDKNAVEASDLYRFSDLRSQYLAEANVDMARQYYAGGNGWYGPGWYWDPWFLSYTWLPGDGIFYSPFGWGYYSPWFVGYAPYYGYGFRGGYGYYGRHYQVGAIPRGNPGRAFAPAPRGGRSFGVMGGGFRSGGFAGGGGFHGGGGGGHH